MPDAGTRVVLHSDTRPSASAARVMPARRGQRWSRAPLPGGIDCDPCADRKQRYGVETEARHGEEDREGRDGQGYRCNHPPAALILESE